MNATDWILPSVYLGVLILAALPLGRLMAVVLAGRRHRWSSVQRSVECLVARLCGFDPDEDMTWTRYACCVLAFSAISLVAVFGLLMFQGQLPWNARKFDGIRWDLALNTAVSFVTNTNWQAYSGESTLSAFSQALALTVQNFVSAAVGIAVMMALIRGLVGRTRVEEGLPARSSSDVPSADRHVPQLGCFWIDLTRASLFVLLPLSIVLAIALVSQGVVQTLSEQITVTLLEPVTTADGTVVREQTLPLGMAASQVAIKQLGTNGGGFFGVNSAHPFENPTGLSNLLQLLAILLIPAALCETFGVLVGDVRQGRMLLAAMLLIFIPCVIAAEVAEHREIPIVAEASGADASSTGNLEGKELRLGTTSSVLWAVATTAASNGSVNCMHDSLTPLAGLVPLWLMQCGEVVFGGVGCGLYGMIVFAIVTVFISGLMVGRTPEYLGRKIEAREMKLAALVILIPSILVLLGTAVAVMRTEGTSAVSNPGPHAFSQILYAFSSAGNNNGSAFAGLSVNSPFYNVMLSVAMLVSRFGLIVPVLALAGAMSKKPVVPETSGTLPTNNLLFAVLLAGIVVLVGALTFVPALVLGPVADHMELVAGNQ
jgi:K+-transporting ATPase ATPase A chain